MPGVSKYFSTRLPDASLATDRTQTAEDWLRVQRALWERRLDRFDAYVSTLKKDTDS